jgi:hypothetical protein
MTLVFAQAGLALGLGQVLILLVVLAALWAIFATLVAPRLPPAAGTVINIVAGAIVAIVAIKVLLSFL